MRVHVRAWFALILFALAGLGFGSGMLGSSKDSSVVVDGGGGLPPNPPPRV